MRSAPLARCTLLACAAAFLAGCGGTADRPAPAGPGRLALSTLGAVPEGDSVVARIDPPSDPSDWMISADDARTADLDTGEPALRLSGGEQVTIRVPGPFDPATFSMVAVDFAAMTTTSIRVGFVRRGAEDGSEDDVIGAGGFRELFRGERERAKFDTRRLRREEPFDELLIVALGRTRHGLEWSLASIELVERPIERWLPLAGTPGLILVGHEARDGVGLSTRTPLAARFLAPEGSPALSFACGWPDSMPTRNGGTVVVTLESGALEREERVSLPPPPRGRGAEPAVWTWREIDLEGFAGQEVAVRFELEAGTETACALAEVAVHAPAANAPTVLLVTSDTHRGDHIGAIDRTGVLTPNLDGLAERGILFEDCFASANITLPSHAAVLTGVHPRDSGIVSNHNRLSDRADTLAERFREAGWITWAATSAKHMNHPWSGLGQGFDRMTWPMVDRDATADMTVDRIEGWLPDADGKPLFVWIHLFDAHRPYSPPEGFWEDYYPEGRDAFDTSLPPPDFPPLPGIKGLRDIEWAFAHYKGEVTYLDQQIGRVLSRSRFEDGVVCVVGDHGESMGPHGVWWNHVGLYPDMLHVPLVLAYPDAPAGTRVTGRVRQWDVGHTLLGIAGLDASDFPGDDLRLRAEDPDAPEPVRFGIATDGASASMNVGRWHLIVYIRRYRKDPGSEEHWFQSHSVELYDLDTDPTCENNLVGTELERARKMRQRLLDWLAAAPPQKLSAKNQVTVEANELMESLGYAADSAASTEQLIADDCECEYCAVFR